MSSPKRAAKTTSKTAVKTVAKAAVRRASAVRPVPPVVAVANGATAEAKRVAAALERIVVDGNLDAISVEALQALMAAACKAYAAQVEAGNPMAALAPRTTVTPTEVMVTASGLLRATNLAVFELGMWQSWTGR